MEIKAFQALIGELKQAHTQVLGVNTDSISSHIKIKDKFKITYPLLSDIDSTLAKQLGIAKPTILKNNLKQSGRHTFIIKNGKIIKEFKKIKLPWKHPAEVLEYIKRI